MDTRPPLMCDNARSWRNFRSFLPLQATRQMEIHFCSFLTMCIGENAWNMMECEQKTQPYAAVIHRDVSTRILIFSAELRLPMQKLFSPSDLQDFIKLTHVGDGFHNGLPPRGSYFVVKDQNMNDLSFRCFFRKWVYKMTSVALFKGIDSYATNVNRASLRAERIASFVFIIDEFWNTHQSSKKAWLFLESIVWTANLDCNRTWSLFFV